MKKPAKIYYFTLTDEMPREDKLNWFANTKFEDIPFNILSSKYLIDLHFNGDSQCLPLY
ncbi:hypothetical protein QUF82_17330 [Thiotrichales bacterium HSG14]|nr:hypothetical protein [Thiotrichales bacterium HSG14]